MGNITLFHTDNLFSFKNNSFGITGLFKKRKREKYMRILLEDINRIISSEAVDKTFAMTHILNKICQITKAEYGFIGKVEYTEDGEPKMYMHAISNIAWNSASFDFYQTHLNTPVMFNSMGTLFGDALETGETVIVNSYDTSRLRLPEGHPMIKRFMAVPFSFGPNSRPVCIAGICNKLSKFDNTDVVHVKRILNIVAYIYLNSTPETQKTILSHGSIC